MAKKNVSKIRFFDLVERHRRSLEELDNEIDVLSARKDLSSSEKQRLNDLRQLSRAATVYRDPLFVAVRHQFMRPLNGMQPIAIELDLQGSDQGRITVQSKAEPSDVKLNEIKSKSEQLIKAANTTLAKGKQTPDNMFANQISVFEELSGKASQSLSDAGEDREKVAMATGAVVKLWSEIYSVARWTDRVAGLPTELKEILKESERSFNEAIELNANARLAGTVESRGLTALEEEQLIAVIALTIGLLEARGVSPPSLRVDDAGAVVPAADDPAAAKFIEEFFPANGRAASDPRLALNVLKLLGEAVEPSDGRGHPRVSTADFANVYEKLSDKGIKADDPNLKRRVEDALDRVQDMGPDRPIHETLIDLPDLEVTTDLQIIEDNVRVMGPLIYASMFDELKVFQVVERLVDSARRGELSLIKGDAGTQLYNYWRQAPNRMSDLERQTFYAMTLGIPSGQPGVTVNTEFQDLWLRFVSSASELVRESRVEQLLRARVPAAVNQQRVKKAARDLVANMSLFGYGMTYYAAIDLQNQIKEMIALLSDKELRASFGARDMWGVIDQVAQTELGGARNSSKYRALATSGAIITSWLADNLDRIRHPTDPIIRLQDVENPPGRASGQSATRNPTDYDLVNACDLWIADSAMGEDRVDLMSQPRESPQQPSRPIFIPSMARELLDNAGLGLQMGMVNGSARQRNGGSHGYKGY